MSPGKRIQKTMVGAIHPDVLAYTVGKDPLLDLALVEADCIGSAAHATMLAAVPVRPRILRAKEKQDLVRALVAIMRDARRGRFAISNSDQDVHLAIERVLTAKLGEPGRRIHTARSRNDQVATDLRLYAKDELLAVLADIATLTGSLLRLGEDHALVPMVGRTHMQPAMPSAVGLWASSHAESLLDDTELLRTAFALNNRSPLGSAAGYGVPLPIDREMTAKRLGFDEPIHNVLHASNARGKCESIILSALAQVMLSLSRLAEDLLLYSLPEFGYFQLAEEVCTGSSIMPQKRNPDVLELVRARCARMLGHATAAMALLKGLPGGYNRDMQETKELLLDGFEIAASSLQVMTIVVETLDVNAEALVGGFTPDVFATDRALELVAGGLPFRDAYDRVRGQLDELAGVDSHEAVRKKTHAGAPAGLDWPRMARRVTEVNAFASAEQRRYHRCVSKLLGVRYPSLDQQDAQAGRKGT